MIEKIKNVEPSPKKGIVNVIVEISRGSMNKYEVDKNTGLIKLDRVLYSAMHYPFDYGFIPNTLCDDGDPLDVIIISSEPLIPGSLVEVRVIGGMKMIDSGEQDDKLIGVVDKDFRWDHVETLENIGRNKLEEIKHFFEHYKDLQGKEVLIEKFISKEEALKILEESIELFKKERH